MSRCRLCLQTDPSIYIFDKIKTLPEKIWNCCQLTVTENDGLSNQICSSCETILESFNKFKCICEKSEAFLKEQYAQGINIKIEYSDIASEGLNVSELSCNEFDIKEEIPFEEDFLLETETAKKECLLEEKRSNKGSKKLRKLKKHKKKKISCEICGKIVSSTLNQHMFRMHNIDSSDRASDKKENVHIVDIEILHLNGESDLIEDKNNKNIKIECQICGRVLKSHLKRHMRRLHSDYLSSLNATLSERVPVQVKKSDDIENEKEPFLYSDSETTCNICGKILKSSSLQRHMLRVHKEKRIFLKKRFRCNICKKVVLSAKKHLLEDHSGNNPEYEIQQCHYECSACNDMHFDEYIDGKNHMKTVHNVDIHMKSKDPCRVCGKLLHKSLMKRHINATHKINSKKTKEKAENGKVKESGNEKSPCRVCKKLIMMKNMKIHMKLKHETNIMHRCDICDKELTTKHSLKRHMNVVHSTDTFECDLCHKFFNCKRNIIRHWKRHMYGKSAYKFACDQCDFQSETNYKLRQHILAIHMNIRPYQCSVCGKMFKSFTSHKVHMRQHEDRYYFECDYCGKKFKFKVSLISHIISHTKIKQYQCNICDKKLATKTVLKYHMYIHTGENPYSCKLCYKRFKQSCNLKVHMRSCYKRLSVVS